MYFLKMVRCVFFNSQCTVQMVQYILRMQYIFLLYYNSKIRNYFNDNRYISMMHLLDQVPAVQCCSHFCLINYYFRFIIANVLNRL